MPIQCRTYLLILRPMQNEIARALTPCWPSNDEFQVQYARQLRIDEPLATRRLATCRGLAWSRTENWRPRTPRLPSSFEMEGVLSGFPIRFVHKHTDLGTM
jgi:hypothetical protein